MSKHGVAAEKYRPDEYTSWADTQKAMLASQHRGLAPLDYWEMQINERHKVRNNRTRIPCFVTHKRFLQDYVAIKAERDKTADALYQAAQRRFVDL
jgi:hypothetical protein